jgi:hypothetical protein
MDLANMREKGVRSLAVMCQRRSLPGDPTAAGLQEDSSKSGPCRLKPAEATTHQGSLFHSHGERYNGVTEIAIREDTSQRHVNILPGRGSAGSWRHQDDTGTVAPRKLTSSGAPANRKALARSRLLNGKDLSRTSAAPRPRND